MRMLFLVTFRMSVLVYRSLNSVSSASSGVGSLLHPPLTICLNNSIQQVSNFLIFSSFIYQASPSITRGGIAHMPPIRLVLGSLSMERRRWVQSESKYHLECSWWFSPQLYFNVLYEIISIKQPSDYLHIIQSTTFPLFSVCTERWDM